MNFLTKDSSNFARNLPQSKEISVTQGREVAPIIMSALISTAMPVSPELFDLFVVLFFILYHISTIKIMNNLNYKWIVLEAKTCAYRGPFPEKEHINK